MIKIKNLYAGYGKLEILKGISLEIKKGEIVSVIGPNGAGKSTLLRSIFNLADIFRGDILFNKKTILGSMPHELIRKGIVFLNQEKIVFDNLTVEENLEIGILDLPKEEIKRKLELVYKKFPFLKNKKNMLAYKLSGGQRRTVALSRALLQKPSLMLLDEPSLGLSPKLQKEFFENIRKLRDREKISLVIVEQNAKKAIEISDRTFLMEEGKIVLSGGKEIINDEKIKKVYLGGRY